MQNEQKAEKRIDNARERYNQAVNRFKIAKEKYYKIIAEFNDFETQIETHEYFSRSGIKVDIPFVPSSDEKVRIMMEFTGDIKGKKVADLGCGNGKLLLELAKKGAQVYGYELEPLLIQEAETRLTNNGFKDYKIFQQSFLEADLSKYVVLTIYGITSVMDKLEKKLLQELKPNAIVIANTFDFPNWKPIDKRNSVYLYRK